MNKFSRRVAMISKMENSLYENSISEFSEIFRKKCRGYKKEEVLSIIKVLEHFEDYERCQRLKDLMDQIFIK